MGDEPTFARLVQVPGKFGNSCFAVTIEDEILVVDRDASPTDGKRTIVCTEKGYLLRKWVKDGGSFYLKHLTLDLPLIDPEVDKPYVVGTVIHSFISRPE